MRFYKIIDSYTDELEAIGTGEFGGEEITEDEYNALMAEIMASIPPRPDTPTLREIAAILRGETE